MFERFSEPACRVVFWARAEAGRLGADAIQPEHLLLGWLAEDQRDGLPTSASHAGNETAAIWSDQASPFFSKEIAANLRQVLSNSIADPRPAGIDMPVTEGTGRALVSAQARAGDSIVELLHILWALISDQQNSVSKLLKSNGVTVEQIDAAIQGSK